MKLAKLGFTWLNAKPQLGSTNYLCILTCNQVVAKLELIMTRYGWEKCANNIAYMICLTCVLNKLS